ncbi:bifunctional glucose-1-phosphatase/inositol phosphatase [Erwinia sp. OLTSP20]|uniref:bifunctional glucose-1-phosphatase/inositol phosphatase n=1 Tax=unclassified Erwinia TaxID=2622719 RepID=UPI000C176BCE|nr:MULTISPECIES: bifunctional glucose-1-phosphatase/inositol phosphatase [unclassified Erwinia]PIJ51367.1 bifunctional glucose-1-phosphatase/inositol phosphatase [Erwinia sp. OAMSP11]PIJ74151.1 bifunctional glucose-1-phosphatase/inositol phosphatase [Erwinia sp. OLSSP12]PIJ81559.1 bifunctional glucose-1-phosphatase/inositol phosphatase [Erwinia sp. OLCASP19]PIJ86114.1 bifunctional glucose-1-phosphatase/inositol phosphatase [Erwinia sp. OLMTSP26]PIJ87862.1 bifunctional glucose-1-phosphatase/ino
MIKNINLCAVSVCAALSVGTAWGADGDYQLEQVLMLSRHNLRAPLANNGSVLQQATKKSWPSWQVPGGQLTTKGGILEVYMGNYTREWLVRQGLIKAGECPTDNTVYAYANSLQRTLATAQYFITGAFPGCDVPVSHQDEMGAMDPIFNPVITNGNADFHKQALNDLADADKKLALKPALQRLEKIIDYRTSPECSGKKKCDLSDSEQNKFTADNGKEPGVSGPLRTANALVDAFTLQYYEGMPLDQVAWGQIKTAEQWKALSAIKNAYQDTLFGTPAIARNVAAPLLDYMRSMLVDQDKDSAPKVTLMVGHDSNIGSVLTALDFKPYILPLQNEETPIGGMLVFERWHDKKANRDLAKVEYVYQSTEQLRNALPLSLDAPPQRVTLQMNGCQPDANGYCPWDQFVNVLNVALQNTAMAPQPAADAAAAAAKAAQQKAADDKAAAEKAAQQKAADDKAAAEKAAQQKAAADKAAAEKAAQQKAAADKAAAEKAAQQKAAADKAAAEKATQQKAADDKAATEQAAQEKAAADKAAADKAAADKASQQKVPADNNASASVSVKATEGAGGQ